MSFADEELDVILRRKIGPFDQVEVSRRVDIMKRRLNSRCKGFLEVGTVSVYCSTSATSVTAAQDFSSTVQYLHRTVKDFLETPKVWNWLLASRIHPYDPYLSLSKAMLGTLRHIVGEDTDQIISPSGFADNDQPSKGLYQSLISKCLFYAMEVQSESNQNIVQILESLDETASDLVCPKEMRSTGGMKWGNVIAGDSETVTSSQYILAFTTNWTRILFGSHSGIGHSFLSLAVRLDLLAYVKSKVKPGCIIMQEDGIWPLLLDSVTTKDWYELQGLPSPQPSKRMVKFLLDNGADPNRAYSCHTRPNAYALSRVGKWTAWQHLLYQPGSKVYPWLEIVPLFLHHKADITLLRSLKFHSPSLGDPDYFSHSRSPTMVGQVLQSLLAPSVGWPNLNWFNLNTSGAKEREIKTLLVSLSRYSQQRQVSQDTQQRDSESDLEDSEG